MTFLQTSSLHCGVSMFELLANNFLLPCPSQHTTQPCPTWTQPSTERAPAPSAGSNAHHSSLTLLLQRAAKMQALAALTEMCTL